jgi:EmrB/QacA subfamily drug resistance transporter
LTPTPASAPADGGLDRGLLAIAGVVVLGAVMSILDVTVVNVAINTLAAEFNTDLPTIQWIVTGYTLALATVIPVTGWAADRFGTKRLYLLSIGLFMAGSALSGLAWSAESLIAFRVLQGLGGGMLMPLGMTILTRAAGPQRVGRVMSIIGVPMLLGPILGPILGGWLVDDVSWRWIFFINVPIGIVSLIMAARILPRDTPAPQHGFDALGLALLSPGLALLIYGLAESSSSGGFGDSSVLGPALVGAALLVAFVLHALRASEPLIDLRLFKNRTFATASGMLTLFAIAVFGTMLLLPIYLQSVRGESALTSGLLLAPQGLGAMLLMPIAGQLADRTGIGRIVLGGMTLILASTLALTQIAADTSYWTLGLVLFVFGMGMGATMMPIMTGALQTLRKAAIARASTTLNIIQQVGASIGTAVMTVILTNALAERAPEPAAAAGAFGETFWWALALLVVAFAAAFLLPRSKPEPVEEDESDEHLGTVLIHA